MNFPVECVVCGKTIKKNQARKVVEVDGFAVCRKHPFPGKSEVDSEGNEDTEQKD